MCSYYRYTCPRCRDVGVETFERKAKHVKRFERKIYFSLPIVRSFDVLSDERVKAKKAHFAYRPRYLLGKETSVPTEYASGWAPEPVWMLWKKANISCLYWESNPGPFSSESVSIQTTIWRHPPSQKYEV
jgi:hypothetical protein